MDGPRVNGGSECSREHNVDASTSATHLPALLRSADGPVQLRIRGLLGTCAYGGVRCGSQVGVEYPHAVLPAGQVHAVALQRDAVVGGRKPAKSPPSRPYAASTLASSYNHL